MEVVKFSGLRSGNSRT